MPFDYTNCEWDFNWHKFDEDEHQWYHIFFESKTIYYNPDKLGCKVPIFGYDVYPDNYDKFFEYTNSKDWKEDNRKLNQVIYDANGWQKMMFLIQHSNETSMHSSGQGGYCSR